jgi:hypothetical protein
MVVWLDGEEVYRRCEMTLRLKSDTLIERFTGRNFHGGSIDAFRPNKTQYMWFDNFKVHTLLLPLAAPISWSSLCDTVTSEAPGEGKAAPVPSAVP